MEDIPNHHKTYMPKNFKTKSGVKAKNDKDNAKVLNTHFYYLFKSQVQVDKTILEEIPQREIESQLDETRSMKEIKSAINSMAHEKALGKSGVTTNMIKNLPEQALNVYVEIIQNFWNEKNIDFLAWHTTLL